ncbi:hypothetical protein [Maribacter sp. HTCC2170]|uniref:hypothetical protein n=1 Tax=Maribacter sp. (strain HTCC2170 / KCCM 42371) TaxID=313603 RepID=UPI00006BD366|nr:hypothetical protein [Maribacter sp. HTCC2170]EAR02175.1 hypothetical protein FB2170_02790 [Maribacter sp. HTCC2170]
MAEKLVILSDMWGAKKGLWITSYLGYLQQYFDITYYDSQQLANIDLDVNSEKNIHEAFVNGGIDTAVTHLMKKEKEACHYLAFSTGGTIAWKANLEGLPMKSLYNVSATRVRLEGKKPNVPTTLLYGDLDANRPSNDLSKKIGLEKEVIKSFGHELYSDEKIIKKVCLDLLSMVTAKLDLTKKAV